MADDTSPARIRWEKHEPGTAVMAYAGHVGTAGLGVFAIFEPDAPGDDHVLTAALPGMGNKRSYGTPGELKAQAEWWLEEFASSLGAVFPDVTLWGVRFDGPGGVIQRYSEEADARQAKRECDRLAPGTPRTVMTRRAWAGPWEVADRG